MMRSSVVRALWLLLFAVTLAVPGVARAVDVLFCAEYRVSYDDDDSLVGDDFFTGHTDGWYQPARGARIKVIDENTGATVQQVYTRDDTGDIGCAFYGVSLDANHTYTVQIRAQNVIGGHTFEVTDAAGLIYVSTGLTGWTPVAGTKVVRTANIHEAWKVAAVAGWALHRRDGGTAADWTFTFDDCPGYDPGEAGGCAETDNQIWLTVASADYKYSIAHEIGHGLTIEVDENSLPNFDYTADPDNCFTDEPAGDSHEGNSKEWQSAAATEGFADFYATMIFNDNNTDDDGWMQRNPYDWDLSSTTNSIAIVPIDGSPQSGVNASNYLEQQCNIPWADMGVQYDWSRFLWDVNTDSGGAEPNFAQILAIWDEANPKNWNVADAGNANDDVTARLIDAAQTEGFYTTWTAFDITNGVDH